MSMLFLSVLGLMSTLIIHINGSLGGDDDSEGELWQLRVFEKITKNYRKELKLSRNMTLMRIDPALYGIIAVDEARESIILEMWLQIVWQDEQFRWNPEDYGNLTTLRMLQSVAWMPDITIYEVLEIQRYAEPENSFITITHDGTVFLSRTEQLTVHCALDVANFPDDEQSCTLTYVTWAYPADEIQLRAVYAPQGRIEFYQQNAEWDLHNYSCNEKLVDYGIGHWWELSYTLKIKRKPFYYVVTLTVPTVFITTLALLGLFSPSNANQSRSDRIGIGLTALLTMSVILLLVSEMMPKNATAYPKLGTFLLWEICVVVFSSIISSCLMYVHSAAFFNRKIPKIIRKLILRDLEYETQEEELLLEKIDRLSSEDPVGEVPFLSYDNQTFNSLPGTEQERLQQHIYLTMRQIFYKTRELQNHLNTCAYEYVRRVNADTAWTTVCYRLDCYCLLSMMTINILGFLYFWMN